MRWKEILSPDTTWPLYHARFSPPPGVEYVAFVTLHEGVLERKHGPHRVPRYNLEILLGVHINTVKENRHNHRHHQPAG